jgi:hypothetical protein
VAKRLFCFMLARKKFWLECISDRNRGPLPYSSENISTTFLYGKSHTIGCAISIDCTGTTAGRTP